MSTPLLLVDRDGTIIAEPEDHQVDSLAKVRFVDGVVPALLRLQEAGYRLVMVSNQDGLGTDAFPQEDFDAAHGLVMQVLTSQGVHFSEVLVDRSLPEDHAPTRKPGTGLVTHLLKDRTVDWDRSAVVGDRETDVEFARALGVPAYQLATEEELGGTWTWAAVAHELVDRPRRATVERATSETRIRVAVDLDDPAPARVSTGLGFFDHMLDQLGKHGGFALQVDCRGDLEIDEHHTVEDTGIAIGQALREALGTKTGIGRYGFTLPMDESLATAAVDLSGRPYLVFDCTFTREMVGDLPTEMVEHFWRSLCDGAGLTLNLSVQAGNDHHRVEVGFKAVARALRQAIARTGTGLPSTKGTL
ncbi:bifunctional histidinol-phosphatase/imidazoleglycerol-phosphate dehydratase [Kytococcus schroeteri]|uniref:Histidine biosynthesis bifunctional protein HisB n=1 Tax=Kytococcus schroeteri TaxID=138300 RepID=A0A2I1P9J7_9MICO|nr:bifunctional histidinol-phosphatase/imidazoleglycerol-phosphate dehydratase HisB [Kytococcus schroeteri]PKZ41262.1 bifunctional histidinol-phosphatase/imidazoleglycerol-phosphate dehydratase [Kytococcus schroeteri]